MRLRNTRLCYILMALTFAPNAMASDMVDEVSSISIIADSSLALPMTDIILQYTKEKHKAVSASFQPPSEQEVEVSEGASYDVLITARTRLIDDLKLSGLVDIYSEATIAKNHLVLVASSNNDFQTSLADSFPVAEIIRRYSWRLGLVLGNPETLQQGSVARDALRHYGALEDLESYTLYMKDMSEILDMVRDDGVLALVYESDMMGQPELRIVDSVPEKTHQPVVYMAVVLAGDKMDDARQFVDYLKQSQSQKLIEKYGFSKP